MSQQIQNIVKTQGNIVQGQVIPLEFSIGSDGVDFVDVYVLDAQGNVVEQGADTVQLTLSRGVLGTNGLYNSPTLTVTSKDQAGELRLLAFRRSATAGFLDIESLPLDAIAGPINLSVDRVYRILQELRQKANHSPVLVKEDGSNPLPDTPLVAPPSTILSSDKDGNIRMHTAREVFADNHPEVVTADVTETEFQFAQSPNETEETKAAAAQTHQQDAILLPATGNQPAERVHRLGHKSGDYVGVYYIEDLEEFEETDFFKVVKTTIDVPIGTAVSGVDPTTETQRVARIVFKQAGEFNIHIHKDIAISSATFTGSEKGELAFLPQLHRIGGQVIDLGRTLFIQRNIQRTDSIDWLIDKSTGYVTVKAGDYITFHLEWETTAKGSDETVSFRLTAPVKDSEIGTTVVHDERILIAFRETLVGGLPIPNWEETNRDNNSYIAHKPTLVKPHGAAGNKPTDLTLASDSVGSRELQEDSVGLDELKDGERTMLESAVNYDNTRISNDNTKLIIAKIDTTGAVEEKELILPTSTGGEAAPTPHASESTRGIAELATDAEAKAGTDDSKIMTPLKVKSARATVESNLSAITTRVTTAEGNITGNDTDILALQEKTGDASETAKGVIEIATQTETQTGTDDEKAVTPEKLKGVLDTTFPSARRVPALGDAGEVVTVNATGDGLEFQPASTGGDTTPTPNASESTRGIAELATQAEAQTGTDDEKIVTPEKLKGVLDTTFPTKRRIPDFAQGDAGEIVKVNAAGDGLEIAPAAPSAPALALASEAEAEAGTDNTKVMTPLRTKQSIDHHRVPTETNLPANPRLNERVISTSSTTFHKDRLLYATTTPNVEQYVFPDVPETGIHSIVGYSLGHSQATLRNKVFLVLQGTTSLPAGAQVAIYREGQTRKIYNISDTAFTGFAHWFQILKATDDPSGSDLAYDDVDDTQNRYGINYRTSPTAPWQYPDETYAAGDWTYSENGWIRTPGLGLDRQQVLDLIRQNTVSEAITELIDGPGAGLAVTNASQAAYSAATAQNTFTNSLDLDDSPAGVIEVEATLSMATRGNRNMGFVSGGGATTPTARITGFTFASSVEESEDFASASEYGVQIGSVPVYAGSTKIGDILFYISKDSDNALGYNYRYAPAAGAGSQNFTISINLRTAFLHQEAGTAEGGGGGAVTIPLATQVTSRTYQNLLSSTDINFKFSDFEDGRGVVATWRYMMATEELSTFPISGDSTVLVSSFTPTSRKRLKIRKGSTQVDGVLLALQTSNDLALVVNADLGNMNLIRLGSSFSAGGARSAGERLNGKASFFYIWSGAGPSAQGINMRFSSSDSTVTMELSEPSVSVTLPPSEVLCRVTRSTVLSVSRSGQKVDWDDTAVIDTHSAWSSANNEITIPRPGRYMVSVAAVLSFIPANGSASLKVVKNGGDVVFEVSQRWGGSSANHANALARTSSRVLARGDKLHVEVILWDGASSCFVSDAPNVNEFLVASL